MNYIYILLKRDLNINTTDVVCCYRSEEEVVTAIELVAEGYNNMNYVIQKVNELYYIVKERDEYGERPVYVLYVAGSRVK